MTEKHPNQNNGYKKFDLHIHSTCSKHPFFGVDGMCPPKEIIKMAVKKGLNGIAVTDHNTVRGSLLIAKIAKNFNNNHNLLVIPGIELRSKQGDILALGVTKEIKGTKKLDAVEVVEKIQDLVRNLNAASSAGPRYHGRVRWGRIRYLDNGDKLLYTDDITFARVLGLRYKWNQEVGGWSWINSRLVARWALSPGEDRGWARFSVARLRRLAQTWLSCSEILMSRKRQPKTSGKWEKRLLPSRST